MRTLCFGTGGVRPTLPGGGNPGDVQLGTPRVHLSVPRQSARHASRHVSAVGSRLLPDRLEVCEDGISFSHIKKTCPGDEFGLFFFPDRPVKPSPVNINCSD